MKQLYNCIDLGSEYCPCNLAITMDCIYCSHLAGEEFCDCSWNGICIFNEFSMDKKKKSDFRKYYDAIIIDKKILGKALYLLKLQLDKELLFKLDRIGSYIFIKNIDSNNYYDMPMSIFNIDSDYAYIVYQEIGSKTKSIQHADRLTVRGPYWNGIIGEFQLSNIKNSNVLIIARGMGQSSILIALKKIIRNKNKVFMFLDEGKINSFYCLDYINEDDVDIEKLDLISHEGKERLKYFIDNNSIDVILSAGAEILHRNVNKIINESQRDVDLFITNNNIICCGEGICGSCIKKIKTGERIRTCKTMADPKKIY